MGGEEAGGTVNVQPASIRAALAGWRDPYEEIFRRDTV
ncbi:hypothetical protein RAN3_1862 [plant metagenome]|uniref:Uncharacterized protein n=1 Tax=plant metagenome TaxID=1297885 RepID=A0A484VE53_9ZZZZ